MADAKSTEGKLPEVDVANEVSSATTNKPNVGPDATLNAVPEPSPVLVDKSETHDHVAIRDFGARFEHQVLRFSGGEVIDSRVGKALRALGAPIKLVERLAEETKGRL